MQSLSRRQPTREPSVLYDRGATTCQVDRRSLAEPAAVTRHVAVLGDRELSFRSPQVVLITPWIDGDLLRIDKAPTAFGQKFTGRRSAAERQFEAFGGQP